jgi:DNA-binding transcriptional LysR family regulator
MNDLDSVYVFVRTVDAGSFSAAARKLKVTPSAISKKVARLEDRLGVVLLNRTSRKLALTDAGRDFYRTCAQSLAAIGQAEEALSQFSSGAHGLLRVAVPQGFGRLHVAPLIPEFLDRYPGVRIDLLFGRLTGHLFDERVDVIVTTNDPPDSNLVVRPLFSIDRVACAAPAYLARHGRPKTLDDLGEHNCLVFTNSNAADTEWMFRVPGGHRTVRVTGNFQTNNHEALYVAALTGLGIAHMPTHVVAPALHSGELIVLFRDEPLAKGAAGRETMNAYYPKSKNRLPKVTAFIDFLAERFKNGVHADGN